MAAPGVAVPEVTLWTSGDSITRFISMSPKEAGSPSGMTAIRFTAIFDGRNDFTITGLATSSSNGTYFGMFGRTDNAQISNLGLINNLADYTGSGDDLEIMLEGW